MQGYNYISKYKQFKRINVTHLHNKYSLRFERSI